MRMRFVCACLVMLVANTCRADLIPITFAGSDEPVGDSVFGNLFLDSAATWDITSHGSDIYTGVLYSAAQTITGTYGAYDFAGTVRLHVTDYPAVFPGGGEVLGSDNWIVRSQTLASNVIDGLSLVGLNLGTFLSPSFDSFTLTPPPLGRFSDGRTGLDTSFWYTMVFSDGTTSSGYLSSIHSVPEPATLSLLGAGLLGMLAARKKRRA